MKHAAPLLSTALALAMLAACSAAPPASDIVLNRASREAQTWDRFLPELYGGLSACLAAHPAQPAYASDVTPQNRGMILVRLVGSDGSRYECSTGSAGNPAPVLSSAAAQKVRGPAFTPATMPEPFMRCGTPQPVLTRDGKLLGWLTDLQQDCPPVATPAASQTWRARGNEPFWSARVNADGVVFDQPGELPRSYAAQAPVEAGNRLTWVLTAPDGNAEDRLELIIVNTPCGDTMADRRFDYRAEVVFRGRAMQGCAEKGHLTP